MQSKRAWIRVCQKSFCKYTRVQSPVGSPYSTEKNQLITSMESLGGLLVHKKTGDLLLQGLLKLFSDVLTPYEVGFSFVSRWFGHPNKQSFKFLQVFHFDSANDV